MAVPPLDELPQQTTIRKQLGTLCTNGVQPYWVIDRCRLLLGLACVRGETSTSSDDELVDCLVSYLRDAVERIESRQHQIILTVVLALDKQYLGTTAIERRTVAGRLFRGQGSKPVMWGTIRQHHEPRALEALAAIVHADEKQVRGE